MGRGEDGGEKQWVAQLSDEFMSKDRFNFFSHGITSVKQQRVGWILLDRPMAHRRLQLLVRSPSHCTSQ